jgi:hypothetical protein
MHEPIANARVGIAKATENPDRCSKLVVAIAESDPMLTKNKKVKNILLKFSNGA